MNQGSPEQEDPQPSRNELDPYSDLPHTAETYQNQTTGPRAPEEHRGQLRMAERLAREHGDGTLPPESAGFEEKEHHGQLRMAERLAREHGNQLRMVHGIGWHIWDGTRWREDDDKAPERAAKATLRAALHEAADELDKSVRKALTSDVGRCESANGIAGMLTLAGQDHPITTAPTRLDADAHLFNTPAGTLDLNSGKLKEHDRADLITKVTTAGFADRPAPIWTAFLERILPDPDVRAFIQRLMGVAMFGAVREQYLPIFTGTGANGKGVFRDALMHAFGDYGFEVDPAMLMQQHNARHGTFLMDLRGRRLVFCSETERGSRFAEAQMKRLTGGDPITANRMHKDPVKFDPSHTLVMITNQLPVVSGDDPAVWRRILVVPFDVTIPVEDRDPGLPEKLKAEADSVLSWAFQGWVEYQRIGLAPPAAVRARTDAYRTDSDVLARFIDERCMLMGQIKARDLFTEFSRWTRAAGEEPGTETSFGKQMAARSMPKQRTTSGFVYKGLMLAAGEEDE